MMTDHRRAIGPALGPVAAGHVGKRGTWKSRAVGPSNRSACRACWACPRGRSRLDPFRPMPSAFVTLLLVECSSSTLRGDHDALGVLPVGRRRYGRAHSRSSDRSTRAPACSGRRARCDHRHRPPRKRLAVLVCALEAAQVGSSAGPGAGHKERHVLDARLRRLRAMPSHPASSGRLQPATSFASCCASRSLPVDASAIRREVRTHNARWSGYGNRFEIILAAKPEFVNGPTTAHGRTQLLR